MATHERQRKIKLCLDNLLIVPAPSLNISIARASTNITTVRIAVAKSVSTHWIPIFAKMAVRSAKKAESQAYIHQIIPAVLKTFGA